MVSKSSPGKKRLKTSSGSQPKNSNRPNETNAQNSLAPAATDPFLDSDSDDDIPSDTVAALNLLKTEFPKLQGVRGVPRF
jgi:hypothetical protein